MASTFGADTSRASDTTSKQTQLIIDQAGFNKIIYDILASDQGLASLATGENLGGGYGSSMKAQLAQDLVIKASGELAKITAPTLEKGKSVSKKSSSGMKTVICTELMRQGKLSEELYNAGHEHFLSLPPEVIVGYRVWADKVVPLMQKSPLLSKMLAPVANARYEMIVNKKFSLIGAATIYIGQPICFLIGTCLENNSGNVSRTS
jgi:hypothetical protein